MQLETEALKYLLAFLESFGYTSDKISQSARTAVAQAAGCSLFRNQPLAEEADVKRVVFAIAVCAMTAAGGTGLCESKKADTVVVKGSPLEIYASFSAVEFFPETVEEAVLGGIPATLTFQVDVYRSRYLWPDEKVSSVVFFRSIKYNHLKNEYMVTLEGGGSSLAVSDFKEARHLVANVDELRLPAEKSLSDEADYYLNYALEVRTDSEDLKLPFYLDYVFRLFRRGSRTGWSEKPLTQ